MNEKTINRNKARILKDSLRIVDVLGKLDVDYIEDNIDIVIDLVEKSKKIKKSKEWKL